MKKHQNPNKFLQDLFSLKGKVAIVTGAARGNGFAIAKGLLGAGAITYFVDIINRPSFKFKNTPSFFIKADITREGDIKNLVETVMTRYNKIDVLINNAAIGLPGSSENYSSDNWNKIIDTDLTSHFKLSQLVARQMIKNKTGGSIINIASVSGYFGFSNHPSYVAAKGGLAALTRALAKDWAKYEIRVNNICPGYIRTNMTKGSYNNFKARNTRLERAMIKRYGEPNDLVGATILLASDAASYITGSDIFIDGGWSTSGI